MKRSISIILCLLLTVFAMAGCSGSSAFVQREYAAGISQVGSISIDVRDRQIEVSVSEDEQIHIVYFESKSEAYDITVSDDSVLSMTSADNKSWTDYIGGKPSAEYRKILLQVPDAALKDLTLSTTNEDISLPALAVAGSISVSSNGGSIAFKGLSVGSALNLSVKNGDISGTVSGSYDEFSIRSEIKKGRSNLPESRDGGEKELNISGNNGDVNIEFVI